MSECKYSLKFLLLELISQLIVMSDDIEIIATLSHSVTHSLSLSLSPSLSSCTKSLPDFFFEQSKFLDFLLSLTRREKKDDYGQV